MTRVLHRRALAAVLLTAWALLPSGRALAHQASISTSYERWSWAGGDAAELLTEIKLGFQPFENLFVDLASGHARVTGESMATLSGVVDSQLRLTYRREALLFQLGVNGPTGQKELDAEESRVAALLADRVLSLPSRILGRGTDVDVAAAYSVPLGETVLGFRAVYLLRDEFRPFEGSSYTPGDRVSGTVALERGTSRWKLRSTIRVGYTFADRLDGEEYVENGLGYEIEALGLKRWVSWSLWARIGLHDFGEPEVFVPGFSAEDFAGRSRRDLLLIVGSRTHLSTRGAVDVSLGGRLLSGAAFDDGAQRLDLRARYSHRVTPAFRLGVAGSLGYARLNDPSTQLGTEDGADLDGLGVTVDLRSTF